MSINQLFEQFLGGQGNGVQNNSAGTSSGLGGLTGGLAGGLAAGGLLGLLVGNKKMRKSVGKFAGGAIGIGGAAALGAVAYGAYKKWQNNKAPGQHTTVGGGQTPGMNQRTSFPVSYDPAEIDFNPAIRPGADGQPFQLALIKAMIAAAKSDGHIDKAEHLAIHEAVSKLELSPKDKGLIFDILQDPPDLKTIAGFAIGLEQASEIYLVSRMAIDPDLPEEKAYLNNLAAELALPQDLVMHLEEQFEQETTKAA